MASATIGALRIVLGLDAANFETGLKGAKRQLKQAGQEMQAIGGGMMRFGAGLTAAITAPLIAAGFTASKAATEAADAMGQVEAALTSMGGASGKTKEELAGLAEGLMRQSLYDDDDILRKVTANLLTFGQVGGENFDRAQLAAVNLATRMRMDLQPATLLIGKALNDPIKGLTAMGRAGIQFTEGQKDTIKSMVAAGNAAGAQTIILGELEKQFGGAAAAAQNTDPYDKTRDSLNTLSESMGAIINRHLAPMLDAVARLADQFNALSPAAQNAVLAGAAIAAALGPVTIAIGAVVSAVGGLVTAFGTGGALAGIAPLLGPIGLAVAGVALAFVAFKDDIIPVLQSFGAALQEHVGPKLKPLFDAVSGMVEQLGKAFSAFFSTEGGSASENLQDFGRMVAQVFGAVVDLITGAVNVITQIMRALGALLTGDWTTMWNALGSAVAALTHGILNAFRTLFPGVLESVRKTYEGVRDWLGNKLADIFGGVIRRVQQVSNAFRDMYIAVVGNSYVPDMVEETGQWMAKLDEVMVKPTQKAAAKAAEAFEEMRDRARAAMESLLTDREKLEVDLRRDLQEYSELRGRPGGLTEEMYQEQVRRRRSRYATDSAGLDADSLTKSDLPDVIDFADDPRHRRLNETWADIQQQIRDSREDFADSFAYGIESAMRGDWRGVLETVVNSIFGDALKDIGRSLFDSFGGDKSGGSFSFSDIGASISSIFSKLPKFANGGTIRAGGSGGVDSQLVSFWKSPSEQVDVYTPGNDAGSVGGSTNIFDLRGALMTADLMSQVNGMVERGEARLRGDVPGMAVSAVREAQERFAYG